MTSDSDPAVIDGDLTTFHVRKAVGGDDESLGWVVTRFSPVLMAQADYRLGAHLCALYDPEDLVSDVWAVAIPKLAELPTRNGRQTPVLMKFLSTTLLYIFNNLVQKHIQGKPVRRAEGASAGEGDGGVGDLVAQTDGVVSRALRSEIRGEVADGLGRLDPANRELIVLRGIEQNPVGVVASLLDAAPNTVTVRYRRALSRLREILPHSIFAEFPDE